MSYFDETRLRLIYEILAKKMSASQSFVQYINANREYGNGNTLHMREAHFIVAVGTEEGKTMSEIAEKLNVTHGAVSQTASRLEKKGYIFRKQDPSDRRHIVVMLTDKGKEFCQRHLEYDSATFAQMDQEYLCRFTDDELRLIRDYEAHMAVYFAQKNKQEKR